ncbi:Esl2p NDAI_0E05070 [Naumovozyma dairenensis CBS 421]|uniref:PIN domain-containing protein n=1 Tax=Naumovozyma dairenensis (strain ATCC 10597 / BCRC 20456 / CBS 421 / NBRC 0211 / NRRL Y-12639) TaxID=1071378 RepID=G0WAQ1_NAUDC|nr:hypothetical protein NDAI_0E05070 [Naumovozyma dairenensis CBS 421]CCD25324.1 hypothetical protein NDAI_0E05070 [Naumovozyma dairenensis CBS 421]
MPQASSSTLRNLVRLPPTNTATATATATNTTTVDPAYNNENNNNNNFDDNSINDGIINNTNNTIDSINNNITNSIGNIARPKRHSSNSYNNYKTIPFTKRRIAACTPININNNNDNYNNNENMILMNNNNNNNNINNSFIDNLDYLSNTNNNTNMSTMAQYTPSKGTTISRRPSIIIRKQQQQQQQSHFTTATTIKSPSNHTSVNITPQASNYDPASEPPNSPYYLTTNSYSNMKNNNNANTTNTNNTIQPSPLPLPLPMDIPTNNSNNNNNNNITRSNNNNPQSRYFSPSPLPPPLQQNHHQQQQTSHLNPISLSNSTSTSNPNINSSALNNNNNNNNNNTNTDNNNSNNNNSNNNKTTNNPHDDNNNNNNNNNNQQPPPPPPPGSSITTKTSSQALIQKLQDIYKLIVKQEIQLQDRCSQLTTSQTTDLKNLWTIYKINLDLINNYINFITNALLPTQSKNDLHIGEEIIEIYRIERRLWVYGTITFLDVLKSFSNFMDPEVCCQFISHVFIAISLILNDIPMKYSIQWLQRLGDLSRMAIALYPSGFIDWKLSAEHWYNEAMKFTYSHGKLYYHMSTVQQNTLEAFVNLGKSVFCQETFTPSQQYMQLVIDNIYQRAFVERNNGNHRNLQLIEYLKHTEVMLLPTFLESLDLQNVVLVYFQTKFGILDSTPQPQTSDNNNNTNGANVNIPYSSSSTTTSSSSSSDNTTRSFTTIDIFRNQDMFIQNPDHLKYFFRHSGTFAQSHILQLVGFGDPKNPFALLFELPKFLKDRKDKKSKRKNSQTATTTTITANTSQTTTTTTNNNIVNMTDNNINTNNDNDNGNCPSKDGSMMSIDYINNINLNSNSSNINQLFDNNYSNILCEEFFENIDLLQFPYKIPQTIEIWLESLKNINLISLKCSIIVLKKFLNGPILIALPHLLTWIHFIISILLKIENSITDNQSKIFWYSFLKCIIPWNSIVNFLNVLMVYLLDNINDENFKLIISLSNKYNSMSSSSLNEMLKFFNQNENLPEIWKCWGTLWFDVICNKNINSDTTFLNQNNNNTTTTTKNNGEDILNDNYDTDKTLRAMGIEDHTILDCPLDGIGFVANDEDGINFYKRSIRLIFLCKSMIETFPNLGLKISHETSNYCRNTKIPQNFILNNFAFKLTNLYDPSLIIIPQTEQNIENENENENDDLEFNKSILSNIMEFFQIHEPIEEINLNLQLQPPLSILGGNENIFNYLGYKRLNFNIQSFHENGEIISGSIYSSWPIDYNKFKEQQQQQQQQEHLVNDSTMKNENVTVGDITPEDASFKEFMKLSFHLKLSTRSNNSQTQNTHKMGVSINKHRTFFVFDATSWLRHFAHIYKLSKNGFLKFAVCLTTFQELRFLRKSKDGNVVEASTRAIITMRQLYKEGKLLPLRFTGNVATDIEEHLEFEEQITWRSHVDEFVIEAIIRSQERFKTKSIQNYNLYNDDDDDDDDTKTGTTTLSNTSVGVDNNVNNSRNTNVENELVTGFSSPTPLPIDVTADDKMNKNQINDIANANATSDIDIDIDANDDEGELFLLMKKISNMLF